MGSALKTRYTLILIAGIVVLTALVWTWQRGDLARITAYIASPETHPSLFLLMFILLPLVGFPISVFLVLLGVKFSAWTGVLLVLIVMPVHLLVSFLTANSLMRAFILRILTKLAYPLPQIPQERALWFSLIFMAVPGLPYTVKNYALPLAGAPFRIYFLSGYLVQGAIGIPLVLAGNAASGKHAVLLGGVIILMIAIYAFVRRLRKRHARLLKTE